MSAAADAPTERFRREVTSFVRRSRRMTPGQRRAWDAYAQHWVLDVPRAATSTSVASGVRLDPAQIFGRTAPLIVEIGPGHGDSLVPMAKARPEANVLAFEVYQPAIAALLNRLDMEDVDNVRLVVANAVDGLKALPSASIDRLWMFFPDPWHKARHRKRRLLTPAFVDLAADRMKPGGVWRLATDWADYAGQMRDVLDDHPAFANDSPSGWAPRWASRPVTRFERRGIEAGRRIFDLAYRRR